MPDVRECLVLEINDKDCRLVSRREAMVREERRERTTVDVRQHLDEG